jgi:hypothetical protein
MSVEQDRWLHGQSAFCATPSCVLHVTADSPSVTGNGQWAVVDGIIYDRHSIDGNGGALYCSGCRKRLLAEYEAAAMMAAAAEARAAASRARAAPTEQTELFTSAATDRAIAE